jgi:hypothetical protein
MWKKEDSQLVVGLDNKMSLDVTHGDLFVYVILSFFFPMIIIY